MSAEELAKQVAAAREATYDEARAAMRKALPALKGMVIDPRDVSKFVMEARVSTIEMQIASLLSMTSQYPGTQPEKMMAELRDYWEAVKLAIAEGAV